MLDRLEFVFGEGLSAFRRNGWMTVAAITTSAIALFMIGCMGFIYSSIQGYVGTLTEQFTMRAYLKAGTPYAEITKTAQQIRSIPGVQEVVWIPKEKAWNKTRKDQPELTEGIENPYPDGFKIKLKELGNATPIIGKIEALPAVDRQEGVKYLHDEMQFLIDSRGAVRWLGFPLAGLGLLIAGILIYNAIRLTVLARRREIRIMQLVGASFATIRVPFLIEGALQGLIGGLMAGGLMFGVYVGLTQRLVEYQALGVLQPFPVATALLGLGAAGAIYGAMCSGLAVRSPLKLGTTAP